MKTDLPGAFLGSLNFDFEDLRQPVVDATNGSIENTRLWQETYYSLKTEPDVLIFAYLYEPMERALCRRMEE